MQLTIRTAVSADDYRAFGALILEYTDWCRARYADDRWFVDAAFGHQALDTELKNLPAAYGPPNGKTLLATIGDQTHGACAYRRLSDEICEMKRLFVPARFQGHGIGRRLGEAIMVAASAEGYALMRLARPAD